MAFNAARAGDADPLSGGRRQCRYDDLWLNDRSASYPASFVIAALFSGVGAGILLGVISGLHFALSSHTLWMGAAAASALFFVLLVILLPSRDHVLPAAAPVKQSISLCPGGCWRTVRAGRILHHCRHLPAANGEKCRFAAVDCPSLVAGRHIDNSGVFLPGCGPPRRWEYCNA